MCQIWFCNSCATITLGYGIMWVPFVFAEISKQHPERMALRITSLALNVLFLGDSIRKTKKFNLQNFTAQADLNPHLSQTDANTIAAYLFTIRTTMLGYIPAVIAAGIRITDPYNKEAELTNLICKGFVPSATILYTLFRLCKVCYTIYLVSKNID